MADDFGFEQLQLDGGTDALHDASTWSIVRYFLRVRNEEPF